MIRSIKNVYHFFTAVVASIRFGFPGRSMTVIAVTGTSGKTTTAHLIYSILKASNKRVSLLSTVEAVINGKSYDTGFHVTTPTSWNLQRFMKEAKLGGSEYFVLEVSSHGLDQRRIFGSSIDIAVVTNIAHDHIDYHGSRESYRRAKAKIFQGAAYAVLNADDENTNFLKREIRSHIVTYGLTTISDVSGRDSISSPILLGTYNTYNILAAVAVSKILQLPPKAVEKAIMQFSGISGRLEKIETGQNFEVYIDFASKPNALQAVLETGRIMTRNKLIVLFGCAGLRDRLKRPMMGEIAAKHADFTILTAEDPRTEDVRDINNQIAKGFIQAGVREADRRREISYYRSLGKSYFWKIPDRQEAINFAIRKLARAGDTILVTGKGHEKSMCYGKIEYPWDEYKAIQKALYGLLRTS